MILTFFKKKLNQKHSLMLHLYLLNGFMESR